MSSPRTFLRCSKRHLIIFSAWVLNAFLLAPLASAIEIDWNVDTGAATDPTYVIGDFTWNSQTQEATGITVVFNNGGAPADPIPSTTFEQFDLYTAGSPSQLFLLPAGVAPSPGTPANTPTVGISVSNDLGDPAATSGLVSVTQTGTANVVNLSPVTLTATAVNYHVGGTVSGLSGNLLLQINGGETVAVSADGAYYFPSALPDATAYTVTIASEPTGQQCSLTNDSGSIAAADVLNVNVTCVDTYFVQGYIGGVPTGQSATLQNNGGDDLLVTANGFFVFGTNLLDGAAYNVTVSSPPPGESCTVSNGSGTISGSSIFNVIVSCTADTYSVGGTVSGLEAGNSVVLQKNGAEKITVSANGSFTFTPIADLSSYSITVDTQPTSPSQTCTISNGSGTLNGADVTNVAVSCVTDTYSVQGYAGGIPAGQSLTLQNNGGDNLVATVDGFFVFPTLLNDGDAFNVTVLTPPPGESCTVTNGSGTIAAADIFNVVVSCAADNYTIGGNVTGLAPGNDVIVQLNGAEKITVSSGSPTFTFTAVPDLSSYSVALDTQPSAPNQTCTVSSGSGTLSGADVTNVVVSCVTDTFEVGGILSGLESGDSVVLQNSLGDDLTLTTNGAFSFATPVDDGAGYSVTVLTQPPAPSETCTVTNGAGVVAGADVTNVSVACALNTFTVGGSVSGLQPGNPVVLSNNGVDNISVSADGGFTFSAALADGSAYSVAVASQPSGQTCTVSGGSGTLSGSNVTSVAVSCSATVTGPPSPNSRAIPAMPGWMLVLMVGLLGSVSWRSLRSLAR